MRVPHIAEIDLDLVSDILHIEEIPSQTWHHIIDDRHPGSQRNQSGCEIRSNEAQPTRHN